VHQAIANSPSPVRVHGAAFSAPLGGRHVHMCSLRLRLPGSSSHHLLSWSWTAVNTHAHHQCVRALRLQENCLLRHIHTQLSPSAQSSPVAARGQHPNPTRPTVPAHIPRALLKLLPTYATHQWWTIVHASGRRRCDRALYACVDFCSAPTPASVASSSLLDGES
jgi:hypothetical protein